jgi:hypothetical protein
LRNRLSVLPLQPQQLISQEPRDVGLSLPHEVFEGILHLPVGVDPEDRAWRSLPRAHRIRHGREFVEKLDRTGISTAVESGKIVVSARHREQHAEGTGGGPECSRWETGCQCHDRRDAGAGSQRDHVVRWKEKDVGVADVVRPGECEIDEIRDREHDAVLRPAPHDVQATDGRKRHTGRTKLLTEIEPVHRRPALQTLLRQTHDEGFPPVGLCDVEPELPNGAGDRCRRFHTAPKAAKVPGVLQGSAECDPDGHRHRP